MKLNLTTDEAQALLDAANAALSGRSPGSMEKDWGTDMAALERAAEKLRGAR